MCSYFNELGFGPLPIVIALIFFIQSFIVYAIALWKHDVDPFFPYLSSAADKRPESCIFALGANASSVLMALLVLIRYRQLRSVFRRSEQYTLYKWNNRLKWFGYLSATGLFIVANVQETAVIPVHMSAAFLTFGGFCAYMVSQCYFTYKITPYVTKWSIFYYRLVCTVLSVISLFTAISCGVLAAHIFHNTYPDLPTPRPWSRHFYQPGYEIHQISAVAEWLCAIFQIFFIQSFGPEFEDISIRFFFEDVNNPIDHNQWEDLHEQHAL